MADSMTKISGPFGSERLPVPEVTDPGVQALNPAQLDGPRVPLTDDTVAGDRGFSEARSAREASLYRPESDGFIGMLEGAGAAVNSWDTAKLIKRLARPVFDAEDDPPINVGEALNTLPIVLDADEREYVIETARGVKSFDFAIEQVKDRRASAKLMGQHPIVSFGASFVDPVWLVAPPAIRLGRSMPRMQRAVAAVSAAGLAGGVSAIGEGPISDRDIALNMLMNGAIAGTLYRNGKLVDADPEFPSNTLNKAVAQTAGRPLTYAEQVSFGMHDNAPSNPSVGPELQPGHVPTDPARVVAAVDEELTKQSKAAGLGSKLSWNIHKSMSSFGQVGKKVADLFYDNNADLGLNSLESHREAIISDLRSDLLVYQDSLRKAMADEGHGLWKQVNPMTSRAAYAKQLQIEREVHLELMRREQQANAARASSDVGVKPHIKQMADAIDKVTKKALQELKAARVEGAEEIVEKSGYMTRRWSSSHIEDVFARMEAKGLSRDKAYAKITGLVSLALRRGNAMEQDLADDIASRIIDRAQRKGYFEESAFNAPTEGGAIGEIRDLLRGMDQGRVEQVIQLLQGKTDEKGKATFLKHRLDLDYRATILLGDENISVMDLIDSRVNTIMDRYVAQVATSSAFARKGLTKRSSITGLHNELAKSVGIESREKAVELFDNTVAYWRGEPNGQRLNDSFRLMQAYTRAISLVWGGLWQGTEYATAMAQYGARKTLKYALQEMPGYRQMMNLPKEEADQLATVLADHSSNSMRMRPFLSRFEDGYEMDTGSALQLAAQPMGNMVPYANAMRFVHHHQTRVVSNLIVDRLGMAAKGDERARAALSKFGLEAPVMDRLAKEIQTHGYTIDKWDDKVWNDVRPALYKMMDHAVLKGRLGDIPEFAAFDQVGKFLFTYRTFVLAAHNKLLAGGLQRDGAGATGLILLYQLPLAMAAVQAQSTLQGKGTLPPERLISKAVGQMGGLGLFSEPWKWAMGESNAIGAPGLIAADRGVKVFSGALQGDPKQAASAALTMIPVLAVNPVWNSMVKQTLSKD